MKFVSTKGTEKVSAREAILRGLPPDNGLYVPESIPKLSAEELSSIWDGRLSDIAYQVTSKFLADEIVPEKRP